LDFLSIPSGSGAEKTKREDDIPGTASESLALNMFKRTSVHKGYSFQEEYLLTQLFKHRSIG
jgi:hypothetical protein